MKLNCGPSYAEKVKAWQEWHPYFAWLPKRVGENDCRWLEWIERKGEYRSYMAALACYGVSPWIWEYRPLITP